MWLRLAMILIVTTLVGACANKFKTDNFTAPESPISSSARVLVLISEDGQYIDQQYAGSGKMLTDQVEIAVSAHLSDATIAHGNDLPAALEQARSGAADYVVEARILHWEDRATEWSGRPDRITIKLVIWDAKTGQSISTSLERASSQWATFGGDHPQDLLPQLLETWSNRVF
jgi:hypothetical protein